MDKYNHWLGKLFGFFGGNKEYAVTFGQTTYYSCDKSIVDSAPWWKVHEDTHKEQYTKDGWFVFLYRYIWQGLTKGYLCIDYEIESRERASKVGGPVYKDLKPSVNILFIFAIVVIIVSILIYFKETI
jgi:hypothetical protein